MTTGFLRTPSGERIATCSWLMIGAVIDRDREIDLAVYDQFIVLDFNHGLITSELTDASSNRLVAEILTRLAD